MRFEPLDSDESAQVERILTRDGSNLVRQVPKMKVAYSYWANFTTALVVTGKAIYVGTAKRNPRDGDNLIVARNVALARAVRSVPVEM